LKGLSRMRGNSHVRFFGGRVDWRQSFGPATAPAYPSGPGQVSEVERIANGPAVCDAAHRPRARSAIGTVGVGHELMTEAVGG
jgi:hypothetical protein